MNKEVSAVDWLVNELKQYNVGALLLKLYKEEIQQAKEMEKQKRTDAYLEGINSVLNTQKPK
jgi:spore coat polysaccharide biosynthesis predicted glycosyltransferase SpsG